MQKKKNIINKRYTSCSNFYFVLMILWHLSINLCIIQADQSGTIVEILAEDGKSVSVDMVSILDLPD